MDTKKNRLHYLQVIHHHIFLQVLIFLLPGPDGGLDGVLFDVRHMEEPLDDYVNVTLLIFEGLLLQIPHLHEIFNTFVLIFCRFVSHKNIFVLYETNRQKYFK